jgi:hypothetical protein
MHKAVVVLAGALAAGWTAPALAQGLENTCAGIPAAFADRCVATVQAAHAVQPALGIVIAGGNPTLGAIGAGGARMFGLPGVSASVRVNLAPIHLPDVTSENDVSAPAPLTEELTVVTIAVGATASAGLTRGLSLAPGIDGVGAIDLLASASYLPFDLINREVYKTSSAQFAWGAGARLGLLRESAAMPGISVSLMHRRLGAVQIGNVCEREQLTDPTSTDTPPTTLCRSDGDVADVNLGLTSWSTRAALSKTVMGLGLAAGVGHDRYESDVDLNIRGPLTGAGQTAGHRIYHRPGGSLESSRWSAFLDAALPLPVGALAAEVGWMQGGDRLTGFSDDSDFDPAAGTWFGSLGARFAF